MIQLKYLLGVVDNGLNITAAADRLFTSQPGVSKQLRQLEQEVGVRIFSRKGKALVGLTPAGTTIVDYARKIMRDVDNIRSVSQDLMAEQEGTLSIATTNTQARYVLPDVISQFHERYPNVSLELHHGTSEQIADLIAEGRVDFAIATDSQTLFPELNLLPCFHWDRIILTKKDHPLATSRRKLSLKALAEHPLITYVFSSNRESSFLRAFAEACVAAPDWERVTEDVRAAMDFGRKKYGASNENLTPKPLPSFAGIRVVVSMIGRDESLRLRPKIPASSTVTPIAPTSALRPAKGWPLCESLAPSTTIRQRPPSNRGGRFTSKVVLSTGRPTT
ncbi:MAG: LysR family transcriptional regulator, partial [Proteobacteria bacterium]|nr:LysR family transcriptional regulator [Pseudomonadota bacterium]